MGLLPSKARPAPPWAARKAGDDYGASDSPDWREVNWREHLHSTGIAGRRVNYIDYGKPSDHAPVVFVHGLSGNWQNWLENIPRVGETRRVLALDLPGFGESEMPVEEITISGYAKTVETLCERLDLGRVVLVGNSMGGFISAELAIQFPERVERLVLVSAAGITTTNLRRRPLLAGARIVAGVTARTVARSKETIVRPRLRHATFSTIMRHPNRLPLDTLYEVTQGAAKPGFLDALDAIIDYDFRDRLPEIRCPTLIVWGSDDMLVPVKDAEEFERSIPNARKIVMEDTGHVAQWERPTAFNDCLLEFLDREEPEREPDAVGAPAEGHDDVHSDGGRAYSGSSAENGSGARNGDASNSRAAERAAADEEPASR